MTEREQATYDLIVKNSKNGYITSKREIVDNYPFSPERKDGYTWNEDPSVHDECSAVWHDINAINFSDKDEIIISEKGFYWVGSREEAKQFIQAYFDKQCSPSLKRYWNLLRKYKTDGAVDVFTEKVRSVFIEDKEIKNGK